MTEILLPRIARQGTVCLIPLRETLAKLELRNLSSMRVSDCIIPPSEQGKKPMEQVWKAGWSDASDAERRKRHPATM